MQVREIMSTDVRLVDPGTTVRDCATRMRDEDLGAFPVGETDRLLGMVTIADLAKAGIQGTELAAYRDVARPSGHKRLM